MSEETFEVRYARKMARLTANQDALDAAVYQLIEHDGAVGWVARHSYDELGSIAEHLPVERESTKRFACSNEAWHRCSFSRPHQQGCKAIGGDGNLVGGHDSAQSCAADCDESAPEESWCGNSGFDCPTCAFVDELLGLLAAHDLQPQFAEVAA